MPEGIERQRNGDPGIRCVDGDGDRGKSAIPAATILKGERPGNQSAAADRASLPPILVIVGPTASGKTGLALELANHLPIEIVNADSRAFYRGMDIGTAKPPRAEQERVKHHLIDILAPDEPMSAAHFQHLATASITAIHHRGHIPVVVGGTSQYVNALVEGWRIPQVPPDHARRRVLEREAELKGVGSVLARLAEVDPEGAARTGPNLRRIIRALEVYESTGVPFSRLTARDDVPFRPLEFELWVPRELLYERIDARVDTMIRDGLAKEVHDLLAAGYDPALPAFSSIGYRQLVPALVHGHDFGAAVERIKVDTHRLVRHQQTWFRKNSRLIRIDMTRAEAVEQVLALAIPHCTPFLDATRATG